MVLRVGEIVQRRREFLGRPAEHELDVEPLVDAERWPERIGRHAHTGHHDTVLVDTADDVGYDASAAIGVDGNPVIAHQNDTNGSLEVARLLYTVTGIAFE